MKKGIIILFWLCIWQLAAVMIHNDILLVGPFQVGRALLENMGRADFLRIVLCSAGRIGLGFFAALFGALLCGALSYRYTLLEEFLSPVITMVKSVPVASFVVLLLIWFGSSRLSFFISFLIVFPNVYVNTIAGLKSTDRQLLEMAEIFGVSAWNRFCFLYRPALMPYLASSLKISLGMSWKSGVAAEVIGIPQYSLGERLYMSKIYLDTAGLFAWTLLVILLSFLFERAVLYILKKLEDWKPCPSIRNRHRKRNNRSGHFVSGSVLSDSVSTDSQKAGGQDIHIRHIVKSYGEQRILEDFSLMMKAGGRYCLMAPSGAGKTTLLNLLNGIVRPEAGTIEGVPDIGMVFQEDRLCGEYDTAVNIMLAYGQAADCGKRGGREEIRNRILAEASEILPEECLTKPVKELSGGMKRRCAVLRAMLSDAEFIVMDEPFAGLDVESRERTAAYILKKLSGRTLLVTTHRTEDVELLGAELVTLR